MAPPDRGSPTASPESKSRSTLWLALPLAFLVLAAFIAQTNLVTPIDPVRGGPQTDQPMVLWVTGEYGNAYRSLQGNHSVQGTTLALGSLNSTSNAGATWSFSFSEAYDLAGRPADLTLWLPAEMSFSRNDTPLLASVDGQAFRFVPSASMNVTWRPTAIYVPGSNQIARLPGLFANFTGNYYYVPLTATAVPVNTTITASVLLPPGVAMTIPNVVFSAAPAASVSSAGMAQARGWVLLPVLGLSVLAVAWLFRKLWHGPLALTLSLGLALRLALAPLFLHTDLVTLTQYPILVYSDGVVNFQSFLYGPTWLVSLVVPPSPFYAAGVTPTADAFNVLFKLTPIVFDGLTYLLLFRYLSDSRGARTAFVWATYGWLLNPLVIYFSAVHGLDESVVAFFVLLTVYLVERRRWSGASLGATLGLLTLYPVVFLWPALLAIKGRPRRFVLYLAALPLVTFGLLIAVLYRSLAPGIAYAAGVLASASPDGLPTYGSVESPMSPWFYVNRAFGLQPMVLVGLAVVVGLFLWLGIRHRGLTVFAVPAATFVSLVIFYLSYLSFFVQLLLWIVPILVVLLARVTGPARLRLAWLIGVSVLVLAINLMTSPLPFLVGALAPLLFALLLTPLLTLLPLPTRSALGPWRRRIGNASSVAGVILVALTAVTTPRVFELTLLASVATVGLVLAALRDHRYARLDRAARSYPFAVFLSVGAAMGYLYHVVEVGHFVLGGLCFAIAFLIALDGLSRVSVLFHDWLAATPRGEVNEGASATS